MDKINTRATNNVFYVQLDGRIVAANGVLVHALAADQSGGWQDENLRIHESSVFHVRVLPDKRIVSVDRSFMHIWREDDSNVSDSKIVSSSGIMSFQALPDERMITGHAGSVIHLWKKDSIGIRIAESLRIPDGYEIRTLQALPDGRIVSGSSDNWIRIWELDDSNKWSYDSIHCGSPVNILQVLRDGRIVAGYADGSIEIWSENADGDDWNNEIVLEEVENQSIRNLQALPDGRIVSGHRSGEVHIWTKKDGTWWSELLSVLQGPIQSLQVLPDGRIFIGSQGGVISIWDGDLVEE